MKTFSLIQSLQDAAPVHVEKPTEPEIVESKTSYQVYVVESDAVKLRIAVPVGRVDEFEPFFADNPEAIVSIEEHLEQFGAVII